MNTDEIFQMQNKIYEKFFLLRNLNNNIFLFCPSQQESLNKNQQIT